MLYTPANKPIPGRPVDLGHPFSRGRVGHWMFNERGGGKVWFTLKEKYSDADASAKIRLDSSDSSEIDIYDAAGGKCYIKVKNTHTQNLTPGAYVYDVQVKRSNGDIGTVLWGTFAVVDDVTRAIA